jgi:O-antigen/teichoic acid export membrane protein
MTKPVSRNIAWIFSGNSLYAASQWCIVILLGRLGGVEAVGHYALGLAISTPLMLFSNLGLRQVQVTDSKDQYRFVDYLWVRILTTLVALFVIIVIVLLLDYETDLKEVILLVTLTKCIESLSDIYYGLEQHHERLDLISQSLILRGLLGLFALGAIYYITSSLVLALAGLFASWTIVFLFFDVRVCTTWTKCYGEKYSLLFNNAPHRGLLSLANLTLPLGIAVLLNSLTINIPRYFIQHHLGSAALGIFAAMSYLIQAMNIMVNAVGQAASPRLARYYAEKRLHPFSMILLRMLIGGAIIGVLGILLAIQFGKVILITIYGPSFSENASILVWIMIVGTVNNLAAFLGVGMTSMRLFRTQLVSFIFIGLINLLACFVLVTNHGLLGAVWAWTTSLLVQAVLAAAIVLHHLYPIPSLRRCSLE